MSILWAKHFKTPFSLALCNTALVNKHLSDSGERSCTCSALCRTCWLQWHNALNFTWWEIPACDLPSSLCGIWLNHFAQPRFGCVGRNDFIKQSLSLSLFSPTYLVLKRNFRVYQSGKIIQAGIFIFYLAPVLVVKLAKLLCLNTWV